MKKIIFKSPIDYTDGVKIIRFEPHREYEVSDTVANSDFIRSFALSIVQIDEPKQVNTAEKPTRRRRRVVNAGSTV